METIEIGAVMLDEKLREIVSFRTYVKPEYSDGIRKKISGEMLAKQYEMTDAERPLLENVWDDFQKEFDSYLGFERRLSLSMALDMAGVAFTGREHDALDDAGNTAELLHIFKDRDLFDKTLRLIKEAMEPKEIGDILGDLFDFSAIVCS